MISHTTLGTNNLETAGHFYFEILTAMGGTQIHKSDTVIFWEFTQPSSKLAITLPYDGTPASAGNGTMVAFKLDSADQVDEIHAKAMALGASCEGEPGQRHGGAYYGAYFRDLDGNKIALFHRPAAQ